MTSTHEVASPKDFKDPGYLGRLAGKNAIITGAAQGMGASHARLFVAHGAQVVLTDLRAREGAALAAELGPHAIFVPHDVTQGDGWQRVVCAAEAAFGPVTVLVNNAGISIEAPITEATDESYQRIIAVNQTSVFLGARAVVPSMRRAGAGAIINISSGAGLVGFARGSVYCASKFAVRGFTKALAIELAGDNIRVNSVHPGVVRTPMIEGLDVPNQVLPLIPLGRIAEPGEVSQLVLFLASDESSYCTGAEFVIDGGLTAQ